MVDISVIIPTSSRSQYLSAALSSILKQELKGGSYEVLVVDNSVAGNLRQYARDVNSQGQGSVSYTSEPRNGLHFARHAGAKGAKGSILVYVDDDVICPQGWLDAIHKRFLADRLAAVVGGKVILNFEVEPPAWLTPRFYPWFSMLDLGEQAFAVKQGVCVYGCNFAVRRDALFRVGGFNPDGFSDRKQIHLRGDGECGLCRKAQDAGWRVWYEPTAYLYHCIPESRLTAAYLTKRIGMDGFERGYVHYRYGCRSLPSLFKQGCVSLRASAEFFLKGFSEADGDEARVFNRGFAALHANALQQYIRLLISPGLRGHILKKSYLSE